MQSFTDHAGRAGKLLAVLVFLSVAPGCGGGGGGDGSTTLGGGSAGGSPATNSPVAITTDNAETVAGSAYRSIYNTYDTGSSGGPIPAGVVVDDTATAGFNLSGFSRQQLDRLSGVNVSGNQFATGVTYTETEFCPSGGTVTFEVVDANNNSEFESGDTFTIKYDNCEEFGLVYSGSVMLSGINITGDPTIPGSAWSISAKYTYSNLSVSDGNNTYAIDGDLSLSAGTQDGVTETGNLSIDSLTLSEGAIVNSLISFSLTYTVNVSNNVFTISAGGKMTHSDKGSITINTLTPLQGILPNHPGIGVLKVTGANNSSLTLTAVDSTNVMLEVDEDGDGVTDNTINTTWAALDAA